MLFNLISYDIDSATGLKCNCVYNVTNAKLYTTHARACKYGDVRGASPVTWQGLDYWLPAGFYGSAGTINTYNILSVAK